MRSTPILLVSLILILFLAGCVNGNDRSTEIADVLARGDVVTCHLSGERENQWSGTTSNVQSDMYLAYGQLRQHMRAGNGNQTLDLNYIYTNGSEHVEVDEGNPAFAGAVEEGCSWVINERMEQTSEGFVTAEWNHEDIVEYIGVNTSMTVEEYEALLRNESLEGGSSLDVSCSVSSDRSVFDLEGTIC